MQIPHTTLQKCLSVQMPNYEECPLLTFRFLSISSKYKLRLCVRCEIKTYLFKKTETFPEGGPGMRMICCIFYLHSSLSATILSSLGDQRRFSGSSSKPITKCFLLQRDWFGQISGWLTSTPQFAAANATSTLEVGYKVQNMIERLKCFDQFSLPPCLTLTVRSLY